MNSKTNSKLDCITYLPCSVRHDRDVTSNAKILYSEILLICEKDGYCEFDLTQFYPLFGDMEWKIRQLLKDLEVKDYLYISKANEDKSGKKRIYLTNKR